jgi:4-hydroxy-tetrahydrodipicolinate synthase
MFHGSIVALVTPMHANSDIDFTSLRKLVDWHVASGTDAIVVTGTTGESPTLDTEEQLAVIKTVIEQAAKRIPIIAGTGNYATHKTIALTRRAMELGVDACLLVTPYYNRPTQEGLFQHYSSIANAVPIPQILYNVPSRTGCDLLPATVARLATIPNIIGIKEGKPEAAREIIAQCGKQFDVLSGDDPTALEIMRMGGKGVISVTANIAPHAVHKMCQAALKGDFVLAEKIDLQLQPLHKKLFVETNPIPVKWALQELGRIPTGIRLPLTLLSSQFHSVVRTAMQEAGVE